MGEVLSSAKKLELEVNNVQKRLDEISSVIDSERLNSWANEGLRCMRKSAEASQEFLSNECAALYCRPKSKKARVLLCGFYGAKNVGDELMLEAMLRLLAGEGLDITILLSNNYDLDASEYAPYKVLHYPKRSSDIMAIAENYDAVIWGGGAMLDDAEYGYRGMYSTMSYIIMSISKAVLKCGGQVFVYGVSSNDKICDKKFVNDLDYIVQHSDFFSLREPNSLATLKDAGVKTDKIKIIDDLSIYNLTSERIKRKNQKNKDKICVGVNLIMSEDRILESKRIVENIIRYFRQPIKIFFIPFYSYKNHDNILLEEILNKLGKSSFEYEIVEQPNNIKELLDIYGKCECLFVMRYHAALIAALTHKRVVMIDYRGQHRHYANKNSYVKIKYAPGLLVFPYDKFCKDGLPRNVEIPEMRVCNKEIANMSENIKNVVQATLKKIKENTDED